MHPNPLLFKVDSGYELGFKNQDTKLYTGVMSPILLKFLSTAIVTYTQIHTYQHINQEKERK